MLHGIKHAGSNSTTPSWNGHENGETGELNLTMDQVSLNIPDHHWEARKYPLHPLLTFLQCFFCEQDLTQAVKYKRVAATFALDKRVRQYATDLGDSRLLTKLAGGDMVATEAEYHANGLTSFYKLHLKYVERSSQTTTSNNIHGIVFAEVVAYIEESRYDDDKPMF